MKRKDAFLLPIEKVEELHGLTPNDPQTLGWELETLGVVDQWKKSRGEDVTVAVIDSGCDVQHPDIRDNIIGQKNLIDNSDNAHDDNGHGSHVCGTIAACDNNKGMVGVAPKAKILVVKALNQHGNGSLNHIADAVRYSADNGADIITMSLGCSVAFSPLRRALDHATRKKCLTFCAAGNSGPSVDIMYPAKYKNTISIGAVNKKLHRTSFTCSGDSLDFLAPGKDIMSIMPSNRYALMSGTSMSNPFAAGVAALYLSYYRKKYNKKYISQEEMVDLLKKHAISLKKPEFQTKKYQGYGIIKPVLE